MTRSDRLHVLLNSFRRLPPPVTAARLAIETGVSIRSIYRDVETLRANGAEIGGEPGYGYTLIEDGTLAPQTFTRMEIEALVLGMGEVRKMGDPALTRAAESILGKVIASLPATSQQQLVHAVSLVHRFDERFPRLPHMQLLRESCWSEDAVRICYTDLRSKRSERTVWPLAFVYLDRTLVLLAWCCKRESFRMFRTERISSAEAGGTSFRPRRARLLRDYITELQGRLAAPDRRS